MTTLLLSSWALPAARPLAAVAQKRGWRATSAAEISNRNELSGDVVIYSSTPEAAQLARRFDLVLLEPPLELLAMLPLNLRMRSIRYGRWSELRQLPQPQFLKPADPLNKAFDVGIYRELAQIRLPHPLPPQTPVLVSEPVEWLCEYRCFVLDRKVAAFSPYLSFGRPLHHHIGSTKESKIPPAVHQVAQHLFSAVQHLPPAFVVDVGLIEDRGWAVVEFNPAWCAGLLSANPVSVLDVLARACRHKAKIHATDKAWHLERPE